MMSMSNLIHTHSMDHMIMTMLDTTTLLHTRSQRDLPAARRACPPLLQVVANRTGGNGRDGKK